MRFFYPIKETLSEIGCLKLYRTFGVLPFEILLRICPAALNGIICYSSCFFVFLFFFSAATVSPQKEEVVTYAHFGGWRQHRQCQLHIHLRVLKTKLDFFFFFSCGTQFIQISQKKWKACHCTTQSVVFKHRVFFFFFFF